ncbi:MAG: TonB-dependent receptor [Flavobacteriaceae bacterium]|nr:TonB-dependent receptor [Flavobacteriaceae bacterium]
MKKTILTFVALIAATVSFAQAGGTVSDDQNNPLPGASVVVKGTTTGATTDFDGVFSIDVNQGDVLVVSFIGFETQEVTYNGDNLEIVLQEGLSLDEVLVTGNRNKPRTAIDSAVPIDNIKTSDILSTGEASLQRALTFAIPSFNAQDQAISDATAGFAPADIRGLGPSRTLVLINGKRVNQQAQAYLNRTPGKGEVGVNLAAIPMAAIASVEVLRDGASAQYGSDAMAGVMNFILKKDSAFSTINVGTGITSAGDGFQFNVDYNTTLPFGNGGRVNLTLGYTDQALTNRAGSPGRSAFDASTALPNELAFADNDATLGMIVGRPDLKQKNVLVNVSHPVGENSEFYTTHSFSDRWNRSFAYYRFPGWRRDVAGNGFINTDTDGSDADGYSDFMGYHPTFEGSIQDHFNVVGFDLDLGNDWRVDLSVTHGKNSIDYTVNRSVNRDYLTAEGWSPTTFNPGGYAFSNVIQNADFTKTFSEKVAFSAGLEYKEETFEAFKGDPFSRYAGGSDSFAGIAAEQEGEWSRTNFAAYAGADIDFSEKLLVAVAARYEDYSDAGDNFSWKLASRYKVSATTALRASVSTGFRAPTLHQQKISNTQYIIVSGSAEPLLQGTIQNGTAAARALGIDDLTNETSQNMSAGITFGNKNGFSGSLDFYNIKVNDRVLFTSQIEGEAGSALEASLQSAGVVAVQAWINAGNTNTTGLDFVLNWRKDNFNLGFNGNFNETTIDSVDTPAELGSVDIFSHKERSLITNSRPKSKMSLTMDYETEKVDFGLYNTHFGAVTIAHDGNDASLDQELSAKLVTDLRVTYKFTPQLRLTGIMNNAFDVYPDITNINTGTTSGGRFLYSSQVSQMGQLGRNYSLALSYKF